MWLQDLLLPLALFISAARSQIGEPPVFVQHGQTAGTGSCVDLDPKCSIWASQGECQANAAWMMANCRRSCQSCQGGERAWGLRGQIATLYDNASVSQNFSISLLSLESFKLEHVEIDQQAELMKIFGKLVLKWDDNRLTWDKDAWGVSWLNFYWKQIWTPQLIQTNAPASYPSNISWSVLAANYTGQAYMWADFSLTSLCSFDYHDYPVDKQTCCFTLDELRYFVVKFNITDNARKAAQMSLNSVHLTGWSVEQIELKEHAQHVQVLQDWHINPFDIMDNACEICIRAKRRTPYLSADLIGPAVAAAIVTLSSFLVANFHFQILMVMLSLVLQVLSMYTLEHKMPPATSGAPSIVRFYSINVALTCLVLLFTIFLNALATVKTIVPPPHWMDKLFGVLEKFLPCLAAANDDEVSLKDEPMGNGIDKQLRSKSSGKCYWLPLATLCKCLLFLIFLAIYIFAMIACLPK